MLFGLIKNSRKKVMESTPVKSQIDSLVAMLKNTERRVIEYHGPSKEFLDFAAQERLPVSIGESTRYGSIAVLARKELEYLFKEEDADFEQRYWAGRALGYKPIEILHLKRGSDFQKPEKAGNDGTSSEHTATPTIDQLALAQANSVFRKTFPNSPRHTHYLLRLAPTQKGYRIVEYTADI